MNFLFDTSLALYLPLCELDSRSFMSRDDYGHICTVTGALWRLDGHYFDGTDDIIAGNKNTDISGNAEFSIEVWFKMLTLANWSVLVFWGAATTLNAASLVTMANGYAGLSFAGGNDAHAPAIVSADTWYHLVGTKTAGAINTTSKIYLNSSLQTLSGASANTPNITNSAPSIGGYSGFGFANCYIGEVRVYKRALSLLEIQHNYLATKWRYQ